MTLREEAEAARKLNRRASRWMVSYVATLIIILIVGVQVNVWVAIALFPIGAYMGVKVRRYSDEAWKALEQVRSKI